jgi:L-seryl-tRNA(Ser) seleniumtransferase
VVETEAVPGGGTVPGLTIPSVGLSLPGDHTAALRAGDPPVVARVCEGSTVLDLRTVGPEDDAVVAKALSALR